MTIETQTPTAEQIARHYSAAMDSVNLINAGRPSQTVKDAEGQESIVFTVSEEDWADTVARNKEHLKIMLAKDFWTTEDLAPLQAASA
jgi:hypothetical protein